MFILRGLLTSALLIGCASAAEVEQIAATRTWTWQVTVAATGQPGEADCTLDLITESYNGRQQISLKRIETLCTLLGPVQVLAAESLDFGAVQIFVEAIRGGGEHAGPVVEVFALTDSALRKIGEQELFDASYQRHDQTIVAVTGKKLFSFCVICGGPDANPDDDFFIPATLTIGCDGLCVTPTIKRAERTAIEKQFAERKAKLLAEVKDEPSAQTRILATERVFRQFLQRH